MVYNTVVGLPFMVSNGIFIQFGRSAANPVKTKTKLMYLKNVPIRVIENKRGQKINEI